MSEHVGSIPLARRRRRKRPTPDEMFAVGMFVLYLAQGAVALGRAATLGPGDDDVGRALCLVVVGATALLLRYIWAPIALPALKRWLWGE